MSKLSAFGVSVCTKTRVTTGLEVVGFGSVSAGIGMIYGPAGWIAGGLSAVLVGFLAGRK